MKIAGALLLIAGGAAMGAARSREYKSRVMQAEALLDALELLESEICRLHTPLPEALARAAALAPAYFAPLETLNGAASDRTFSERRAETLARLPVGEATRAILAGLLETLARDSEPERAFAAARERAELLRRTARREAAEKCRLSSALGLCAGLLLAILLA